MFNVRFVVEQRNKKKCKKLRVIRSATSSADDPKVKDPPLVKDQGGRDPIHALHTLACLLAEQQKRKRSDKSILNIFSRLLMLK